MKKYLIALLVVCYSLNLAAAEHYSIYLVRHAEKETSNKNPGLTPCGKVRAQHLARLLSQANISQVFSTRYQRTLQTANPLALQQKIPVQIYSSKHLEQLVILLKQRSQNSIVVGHSNTTVKMVELLTKQQVKPLTETDFQQLYQVQFISDQVLLTVFNQPLSCAYSKR